MVDSEGEVGGKKRNIWTWIGCGIPVFLVLVFLGMDLAHTFRSAKEAAAEGHALTLTKDVYVALVTRLDSTDGAMPNLSDPGRAKLLLTPYFDIRTGMVQRESFEQHNLESPVKFPEDLHWNATLFGHKLEEVKDPDSIWLFWYTDWTGYYSYETVSGRNRHGLWKSELEQFIAKHVEFDSKLGEASSK